MDDPATFQRTLQEYRNAYIAVNMARANPNTIAIPRNAILAQLDRLQKVIDSENAEIKNFADKSRLAQSDLSQTAEEARGLREKRMKSGDDLARIKYVSGETPPVPDWSPLYRRIGIVASLVIVVYWARTITKV